MSTTPYTLIDTGAAPFTGTAAQTILAAPAPDIDDTDVDDDFNFTLVCTVLNSTGSVGGTSLHLDFLLDGEVARRDTFASIGSNASLRALIANYTLFVTDSTHALIIARPTLSAAGQNGNDIRSRTAAAVEVPFDFSVPIPVDFQVTLSVDDAVNYVCTPLRIRGDKTFPTEASAAVISVNGETGVVVLDATDVGATSADLLGYPVLLNESDPRPTTDKRILFDTGVTQPTIGGSVAEGDLWLTETVIP